MESGHDFSLAVTPSTFVIPSGFSREESAVFRPATKPCSRLPPTLNPRVKPLRFSTPLRLPRLRRPAAADAVLPRPSSLRVSPAPFSAVPPVRWLAVNVNRGSDESSLWLAEAGGTFQEVLRGDEE